MNKLFAMLVSLFSAHDSPIKQAYTQLQKNQAVFVDVREEDEIKGGMIKGASWFPLSKITSTDDWTDEFMKVTQGKKIYLYCRSGNRSGKVLQMLKEKGIESINIGGFEDLKKQLPTK